MSTLKQTLLLGLILAVAFTYGLVFADEPTPTDEAPTPSEPQFTQWDVIEKVNDLRVANGLQTLEVHPVLMQVAQIEADGVAGGYSGHWRPANLTLGQWLLSLGYPLSGDLSMDGYRAENWFVADLSSSLEDVTGWWQGDAEHRDTMFSPDRSDIGAAVTVDENGQVVIVLETALRTASGKMQSDAYDILTGIPQTQVAFSGMATQAAANGLPSQYSIPVKLSTAQADGNLYHVVQYGQSLWSIAIAYHTTIKQIQALNNLPTTMIREGQKLLVMRGVTQPAPTSEAVETPHALDAVPVASRVALQQPAPEQAEQPSPVEDHLSDALSYGAIAFAGLVLGAAFVAMFRKKGGKENQR